MTAEIEDDFVVFLIGMRINKPSQVHRWLPVLLAMLRMLRELSAAPRLGLLGWSTLGRTTVVQYWRSFEDLHAYAHAKDGKHLEAWAAFNRRVSSTTAVGIWHEKYQVRAGEHEAIYRNLPVFGLAAATRSVPATEPLRTARGRWGGSTSPFGEGSGS